MPNSYNDIYIDPDKVGTAYSEEEDERILDEGYSLVQVAVFIGRSYGSVRTRKLRLLDKKKGIVRAGNYPSSSREYQNKWRKKQEEKQPWLFNDSKNKGNLYTDEEDEVVRNSKLSFKERALILGRSINSINSRLRKLNGGRTERRLKKKNDKEI